MSCTSPDDGNGSCAMDDAPNLNFRNSASIIMSDSMIFEKVAHNLQPKELCSLRSTCTSWNRKLTPEFKNRKHRPVRLYSGPAAADFIRCMRSSQEIPYSNYSLGKLGNSDKQRLQNFRNFVAVCGASVKRLKIDSETEKVLGAAGVRSLVLGNHLPNLEDLKIVAHNHGEVDMFGDYLSGGPPMDSNWEKPPGGARTRTSGKVEAEELPRLKRLKFHGCGNQDSDYSYFTRELIKAATGLESLCFKWAQGEEDREALFPLLFAGLRVRHVPLERLFQLKTLKIPLLQALELRVLVDFAKRGGGGAFNRLETFAISESFANNGGNGEEEEADSRTRMRLLREFLGAHTLTLCTLKIAMTGTRPIWAVQIPRMERLHTLQLKQAPNVWYEFEGGLAACLPALCSLHYLDDDTNGPLPPAPPTTPALSPLTVTELRVRMSAPKFGALCCPERLPLVTQAELCLKGAQLRDCIQALTTWPQLTRLVLDLVNPRGVDLDVLLTGISTATMGALRRELQVLSKPLTLKTVKDLATRFKPTGGAKTIVDMVQLRDFTLVTRAGGQTNRGGTRTLSDIGLYFGLALGGPLQRVVLRVEGGNSISVDGVAFLRSVLGPHAFIEILKCF